MALVYPYGDKTEKKVHEKLEYFLSWFVIKKDIKNDEN